jgi:diaminohydroxyphosphoribosylaminopyrimidine deaminase / 5-amino-6-(5-phosphoribosylamino)uracil reductase
MKTNYMQMALQLAKKGEYTVSPNPLVGCVIVKNNEIVGTGWHKGPGLPHAEIAALNEAGSRAKDANVYVNLEPCSHYGKTPPCVDALIKAKIKSVHIPFPDPNPLVNGSGIEKLHLAGIEVIIGEESEAASQINEIFLHYMQTKRPFVIAKWAMTLDGKMAASSGDAKWISNAESRQQTHLLRSKVDAILIGKNTLLRDDPLLTARPDNQANPKQPIRIILDSSGEIPFAKKIFNTKLAGKTIIATTKNITTTSAEVLLIKSDSAGKVDLNHLLDKLGQRNITSILIEGGPQVLTSLWQQKLINKFYAYIAPKIIGGTANYAPVLDLGITKMSDAIDVKIDSYQQIANDLLITGYPIWST